MNINDIKGIVLVLMFIVTFICSMVPVFFVNHIHHVNDSNRRSKYEQILSCMACAAAGVFMGTCILDLFPDVQEQIDILMSQYSLPKAFPVAEFVVVLGFLIVLSMEQVVLDYKERSLTLMINSENRALLADPQRVQQHLQIEHSLSGITDRPDLTASLRHSDLRPCENDQINSIDDSSHHISPHSPLRSLLLLFALSLHSIFEGMAVGLQQTIDNVLALFMVVILHKGTLALSLSINMVQSRLSVKQIVSANLFFCLTAPIGLGVGIGIMEMKTSLATTVLSGVLQGIACGTFLYVTFFEVLPHEMNSGENRLLKLLFVLLGFSVICGMLYVAPDNGRMYCYRATP